MDGSRDRWPADAEFVEYVRARQHRLLRAAYLVCGDLHLAEDLLQGALVKLAREWDHVRDEHPDAYVRRILYRDAVSSWRRRRREVVGIEPAWDAPAAAWEAEVVERRLDVLRALDTLTPRQRATVVLRFFEDRSERETAEVLGCSVGTVKSQTHDALARLRAAMPRVDLETGGTR
ncbi:SigE family RNA polymerase sigma factor [Oryzobacter terrae]|uniref:SigE family RNA polymerase sigma factor n=1 Tax=Oryzobacter terrae TaxID=1620385 RepID=UPI00366DBA8F